MDIIPAYNIVDTETTGLNPLRDRIIELAVLRVENNNIVDRYNTLINPFMRIDGSITRMTGITQEQLNQSPPFDEVMADIKELLADTLLIAHNARFDYAFIKNEFIRGGNPIRLKTLCTVRLARKLFPQLKSHSLESLITEFNIQTKQRHRALADCLAVYDFLQITAGLMPKQKLDASIADLKKKPSVPRYLKASELDELPEEPGVYIFWSDELALYIGKSVNIRDRVRSHFTNDHATSKDLKISSQIKRIETITTAGELGALLLESRLVKELSPLYNRQLRKEQRPVKIVRKTTTTDYFRAEISSEKVDIKDHQRVLSIHRSKKEAKEWLYSVAEEYDLCPKLLGLENSQKTCFNYQLGRCGGACIQAESELKYNVRFLEAFSAVQAKKWPFEGAVALIEDNGIKKQAHIVNNWCYLGSIDDGSGQADLIEETKFDHDMYKIIKRFLFKKRGNLQIKQFNTDQISAGNDGSVPADNII